jgi:hypothetical protein
MRVDGDWFGIILYSIILVAALILLFAKGCMTSSEETINSVSAYGFKDIRTGDWTIGCSEGERLGRHFTATNSDGKMVSGYVCCGLVFKGCTVRW